MAKEYDDDDDSSYSEMFCTEMLEISINRTENLLSMTEITLSQIQATGLGVHEGDDTYESLIKLIDSSESRMAAFSLAKSFGVLSQSVTDKMDILEKLYMKIIDTASHILAIIPQKGHTRFTIRN